MAYFLYVILALFDMHTSNLAFQCFEILAALPLLPSTKWLRARVAYFQHKKGISFLFQPQNTNDILKWKESWRKLGFFSNVAIAGRGQYHQTFLPSVKLLAHGFQQKNLPINFTNKVKQSSPYLCSIRRIPIAKKASNFARKKSHKNVDEIDPRWCFFTILTYFSTTAVEGKKNSSLVGHSI